MKHRICEMENEINRIIIKLTCERRKIFFPNITGNLYKELGVWLGQNFKGQIDESWVIFALKSVLFYSASHRSLTNN